VAEGGEVLPVAVDGDPAAQAARTPWPIRIYVSGAVKEPGVWELPEGSLAVDAVEAAGGPREDADLDALNLAAALLDNQHVLVPTVTAEHEGAVTADDAAAMPGAGEPDARGEGQDGPININTASAAQLEALPNIGVTRGQAIVTYRQTHGAFHDVEDLLEVPGIGPVTYEAVAPLVTVGPEH
jgi:competence protein ComEA